MRFRTLFTALAVAAVLGFVAGNGFSDEHEDEGGGDMEEMMKLLGTPGPEHAWKNSQAGSWNAQGKFWMEPGQPPIESPGTMVQAWTLGGRYMTTEFVGEFMGKWYYGRGVSGFNNATQKHESVWYDNFNTAIRTLVGTREGDVLTLIGSFEMPGMGTVGTREVTTKIDEDHFKVEAWHVMGDQEFQVMEIQFERAD